MKPPASSVSALLSLAEESLADTQGGFVLADHLPRNQTIGNWSARGMHWSEMGPWYADSPDCGSRLGQCQLGMIGLAAFDRAVNGQVLDKAMAGREGILCGGATNALRLVDGAGDGLPGFALEAYAGKWMAMTPGSEIRADVKDWLKASGRSVYWKRLDQHQKESPMHLYGEAVNGSFLIKENGLDFEVSFQSGYSQGIFLDQRLNRAEVMRRMAGGGKLLNLFSYTGGFSVAGAMGGAETTTLDLSAPYLEWAKRNFRHNGLDHTRHHFCKGDAFHWLKRFAKQGRKFDGIVIDPPTFSRDEKGKVFRVEKDFGELAALAGKVLARGGWMLCCTNFRGISENDFMRMIAMPGMESVAMPEDFPEEGYLKSVWCG